MSRSRLTSAWVTLKIADQHIIPLEDLLPHAEKGTDCMCDPRCEVHGAVLVIIHNSFDGREEDD